MDQMVRESGTGARGIKRYSRVPPPRVFTAKADVTEISASSNGSTANDICAGGDDHSAVVDFKWASRIGVRVCVGGAKVGTLLFYGQTQFADGKWCGVMLDEPVGKNDGTVSGVRYFDCPQGYGIFAPPNKVFLDSENNSDVVEIEQRPTIAPQRPSELQLPLGNGFNGHMTNRTTNNVRKRSMALTSRGSARPSKLRSSESAFSDLDGFNSTVTLNKVKSPVTDGQNHVNDCRENTFDLNATYDRAKPSVVLSSTVSLSKIGAQQDSTFILDRDTTFNINDKLVDSDGTSITSIFTEENEITTNKNEDLENVARKHLMNITATLKSSTSAEEFWNFADNDIDCNDDVSSLAAAAFNDNNIFFKQRQGSVDLDESLGILTPDQMKDFTMPADSTTAQTPSDEGIQEITEEEVIDVDVISRINQAASKILDDTYDFDSPLILGSIDDVRMKRVNQLEKTFEKLTFSDRKTSTPLNTLNWIPSASTVITDISLPEARANQTHFSPNFLNVSFNCKSVAKMDGSLKLDVSDIPEDDCVSSANSSITTVKLNVTDKLDSFCLDGEALKANVIVGVSGGDVIVEAALASKSDIRSFMESTAFDVVKESLTGNLKRDSLQIVPEVSSDGLSMTFSNDDTTMEYLLQRMSNNFAENTMIGKKVDEHVPQLQQMAVSVTSIDTGYQGDAECDMQSDAGTNAANTPVEELSSSNKNFDLPESVKSLKSGDPGSDSDFCSDMGASLTESEMDQVDERSRGRGARVIDGRLYYNSVVGSNASKDVAASNESIAAEEAQKLDQKHQEEFQASNLSSNGQTSEDDVLKKLSASDTDSRNDTVIEVKEAVIENSENVGDKSACKEGIFDSNVFDNSNEAPSLNGSTPKVEDPSDKDSSVLVVDDVIDEIGELPRDCHVGDERPKVSSNVKEIKKTPLSAERIRKTPKKDNSYVINESDAKKLKTPKKNVMSKIKAMIVSTSNILTNKESPPTTVAPTEKLVAVNGNGTVCPETASKNYRTPKKSRWDAVMSKIAAGQVEETKKGRKEVTSRVNTNRVSSKIGASNLHLPAAASAVGKMPYKVPTNVSKVRPNSKSEAVTVTGIRKPSARGSVSSDAADVSIQSRSERSVSQLSNQVTSKLPLTTKPPRPSTLNLIRHPNDPVGPCSPSPSQASIRSCGSRGSTLSQMTLASQASTHPPHDTSFASVDRSLGCGSLKLPRVSGRNVPSLRPPSAAAVIGRRTTMGTTVPNVPSTKTVDISQRVGTSNAGQLRQFKPIAGLVKPSTRHQLQKVEVSSRQLGHPTTTVLRTSAGVATATAVREVSRLEALCEARTKELNYARMQLKHCVIGFDSFAVLIKYLTQEVNAFSVDDLCGQLEVAKKELVNTRQSLEISKVEQQRLQDELTRFQKIQESAKVDLTNRLLREAAESRMVLISEHDSKLSEISDLHRKEIESLCALHTAELTNLQRLHDERLAEINFLNENEQTKLVERYMLEQQDLIKSYRAEVAILRATHEQTESDLLDRIKTLVSECDDLNSQTESLKDELTNDSDYRVQAASVRCNLLRSEVDSLKVVLDMRLVEMQELRKEKLEMSCRAEDFATAKETIRKLEAKNEELEARLANRLRQERQLSSEHQLLLDNFQKELTMSKRLSLENEELQWKLKQNREMQSLLSSIDGSDSSFCKGEPTSGSASMYFWDNEGLLNSSINGAGLGSSPSPKTSFSYFKGPNSTKPATSPMSLQWPSHGSARVSPCKSPSNCTTSFGRPLSAPVTTRDTKENHPYFHLKIHRSSTSEDEGQMECEPKVRLRDKSKRKFIRSSDYTHKVTWSKSPTSSKPDLTTYDVARKKNVDEVDDACCLSEDILVENEAFDCVDESVFIDDVPQVTPQLNKQIDVDEQSSTNLVQPDLLNKANLKSHGIANEVDDELSSSISTFTTPIDCQVPKTTTTVVISFRRNIGNISNNNNNDGSMLDSQCGSSRASSPIPPVVQTSECGDTQSSESSSSRASSVGSRDRLVENHHHLADDRDLMIDSPRVSAGESMMFDDRQLSRLHNHDQAAHLLLKKALQEQLLLDNGCGSSMESSPLTGISKPDTPESMSQAVMMPTDSSNADLSWSDDDLPSETEI